MHRKLLYRIISCVLAFIIFFEPIALQVARAAEEENLPQPTVIDREVGLMDPKDIVAPHDYLDAMLDFRGHNKKQVELRAWGEWQALLNSAYLVIDEGATDVFGLYDALNIAKTVKSTACTVGSTINTVWKFAHLTTQFLENFSAKVNRSKTALKCWVRMNSWTGKAVERCKNSKTLDFLSFCCPPTSWHNAKDTAKGMDQYWHWLQQKGGKEVSTELNNAQGVARTVGIGFAVVGTALAIWTYAKNEDRQVGRWSYNRVKDLVAVGLAAAGIVAMFCIPIVGQVLAIITAIWGVITAIGDYIGKYNKKWKNAYKNSYWYLYENDPDFKTYYDNRAELLEEEKSPCLIVVEDKYKDFKVTEALPEDDDSEEARNSRIYIALEKQGVLTSYYNTKSFDLADFSMDELLELWRMKADYMSWKPTEAEKTKKKSFWQKVGKVFNPDTYISWVGDKFSSKKYNKYVENNNIQKVYFNPDFVLIRKYQLWITANRLIKDDVEDDYDSDFYRMIGLRIEQSPFNYIPLVGIDLSKWNKELMEESLAADAFFVGQKEMTAIHNQIELSTQSLETSLDEADKLVKKIAKDQLPHSQEVREFLNDFAEAYSDKPNKENKKLFNKAKKLIKFEWDDSKQKTPANILEICREDIEKALLYDPLSMSQKAAEMVLLTITVKGQLDMGTLMNAYIEDKREALNGFDNDFKNEDIKLYLKKGTFLDVKGSGFLDWLSELYSAYDETDKTLKQIEKDVKKYNKLAGTGASDKRNVFLWFKKSVTTPPELVELINDELEEWQKTIDAWAEISSDANVKVVLAEDKEFAEKVLSRFDVTPFPLECLDPDDDSVVDTEIVLDEVIIESSEKVLVEE